ncbi:hypothetical protein LXL04_004390 [Taraxacum kok-saghyz]
MLMEIVNPAPLFTQRENERHPILRSRSGTSPRGSCRRWFIPPPLIHRWRLCSRSPAALLHFSHFNLHLHSPPTSVVFNFFIPSLSFYLLSRNSFSLGVRKSYDSSSSFHIICFNSFSVLINFGLSKRYYMDDKQFTVSRFKDGYPLLHRNCIVTCHSKFGIEATPSVIANKVLTRGS